MITTRHLGKRLGASLLLDLFLCVAHSVAPRIAGRYTSRPLRFAVILAAKQGYLQFYALPCGLAVWLASEPSIYSSHRKHSFFSSGCPETTRSRGGNAKGQKLT